MPDSDIEVPSPEEVVIDPNIGSDDVEVAPEPTADETAAREMGWRPEEEYQGDGAWVDAKEFIGRKDLYDGLSKQSKQIKRLNSDLQALKEHNDKIADIQFQKAVREIKAERLQAMHNGEFEKAEALTDKQRELEAEAVQAPPTNEVSPDFVEWAEKNTWYTNDSDLHEAADLIGEIEAKKNPSLRGVDLYNHVTKKIKIAYPDKFKKTIPNGGGTPSRGSTGSTTANMGKLTDEERSVGNNFVKAGGFKNMAEYAEQLDLSNR